MCNPIHFCDDSTCKHCDDDGMCSVIASHVPERINNKTYVVCQTYKDRIVTDDGESTR